jgi:CDGSH-type Zn-finger protein
LQPFPRCGVEYFLKIPFEPCSARIKLLIIFRPSKKTTMATTKITVNSNGSLKIEGDFEIVDKNGNKYDLGGREAVSICRCGLSKNKPFCDASHKGHFEHEAIAFALPPKKTN